MKVSDSQAGSKMYLQVVKQNEGFTEMSVRFNLNGGLGF